LRRLAGIAAVLALIAVVAPSSAGAGEYWTGACAGGDYSGANLIFGGSRQGVASALGCNPGEGLGTYVHAGEQWQPVEASFDVCAPEGTVITGVDVWVEAGWDGSGYGRRIDGGRCGGYGLIDGGALPSSIGLQREAWRQVRRDVGTGGVRFTTYCAASPCRGNGAWAHWGAPAVRISDATAPVISGGGGLWGSRWVRGTQDVVFQATDNVGIRRLYAHVDGAALGWRHVLPACPLDERGRFARLIPCDRSAEVRPGEWTWDTTAWAEGRHSVQLFAEDAVFNHVWSAVHHFDVDNTAPVATLDRPAGSYRREVAWRVADAGSGVDGGSLRAQYRVAGGDWVDAGAGTWDGASFVAPLPAAAPNGALEVRLLGGDNAQPGGNRLAGTVSSVEVDGAAPTAPLMVTPGRWVDVDRYDVALSTPAPYPHSGIAGYSVTRDGSEPDGTVDVTAGYALRDLPEGVTVVRARAVSGAGIAGPVAAGVVRADRTAPAAGVSGAGNPAVPHPGAVVVTISGSDRLSGMGHVAYRLDGAPEWTILPGDEADVRIEGAGRHALAYYVADAAGNRSAEATREIVIAPGAPAPAAGRGSGFRARTANPRTTFTAAPRFGDPCPAAATLPATRDATVAERGAGGAGRLGTGPGVHALVGFDLPAAADCVVESARLRLFAASGGASRIGAARAGFAWDELSVSWLVAPGPVGAASVAGAGSSPGWVEWDVAAQIQALYRRGDNGLILRPAAEGEPEVAFCSREATGADCADRAPQLVVRFAE
jgi:hypothetical protein